MARDGPVCVFTGSPGSACDAAHLLAKSKGDEYIEVVLQDRLNSYDPALESGVLHINSVENGMFLSKILHSFFALGCSAFLKDIKEVMQQRFAERYESIPIPPASLHSSDSNSSLEPGGPDGGDCIPNRQPRGRNHSSNMSDGMLRAMNDVLVLSMLLKGTTPELMATERQRREEVEELRAKEASRVKVQQWIQSSPNIELHSNTASRHHENPQP
ncbi:hypothetical protein APHAL10511_003526 [Amanita phalloides]|nr:hypothetical protein APHAL10511_003526 [Amanita phalloides]